MFKNTHDKNKYLLYKRPFSLLFNNILSKVHFTGIKNTGGIPYTAHGAQIPHPPYPLFIFFFSCFYAYFR